MGTGKRRSNGQLARDRRRIADLYLQGWLQAEIAEEVSLSPATVSRDIKTLHGKWLESALIDFNEAKAQELAKVDRLEREYWIAWERSCQDAETVTEKARASKGQDRPDSVEKTKQAKGQAGDPRFLSGVQWCIEQRCKVLGIEAPKRMDMTTKGESLNERGVDTGAHQRAVTLLTDAFRAELADIGHGESGGMGSNEQAAARRNPK